MVVRGGKANRRVWKQHDLKSVLPTNTTWEHVARATLKVYASAMPARGPVHVFAAGGPWSERRPSKIARLQPNAPFRERPLLKRPNRLRMWFCSAPKAESVHRGRRVSRETKAGNVCQKLKRAPGPRVFRGPPGQRESPERRGRRASREKQGSPVRSALLPVGLLRAGNFSWATL